jgi:hypothetical protein
MSPPVKPGLAPWRVLVEIVGWTGTVCLLGGFLANTQGWLTSDGLPYLLLNVAGAAGVGVHAWVQRSWPAVVVEIVWVGIGLLSLGRAAWSWWGP